VRTIRKPIRTTIDEELLIAVKKEAVEQGINVNDVLEDLIEKFLAWKSMNNPEVKSSSMENVFNAISAETRIALARICESYNLSVTSTLYGFFQDVSDAISKVMLMANYTKKEK
jgi:hypothetical protein